MGYGMKHTKGGFPFKSGDKLPLDANGNQKEMPMSDAQEQAYENAQNDYNTDKPTKAQLLAAHKKLDLEKN